ncbi:E3 ubiquitin-protein ligase HUWE1 isoform X2 [Centruroides vittatus]|uniref:E3 ubiquitin-protein ligase HUWE1 isoform X2 n=1 Tax=Centruroides vittatus TaxID=120091 RepID=UPI003510315E
MKIDRSKLKKSSSEVPADCKSLIEKLKICDHDELLNELKKIRTWNCGKCELYHWIDVLDIFDTILETACQKTKEKQWCLPCDMPGEHKQKELLLQILQFTALLIEHSFSRHFYNSMEHLTTLLSSSDMQVVLGVLNLLYVFSKRSNFITRLNVERRQALLTRLTYLAESWGGKENGFGLAECCQNLPISHFPSSATTLHFEFYLENADEKSVKRHLPNTMCCIHVENVDQILDKNPSQIMEDLIETHCVAESKQMLLFTHLRLAHSFSDYSKRLQCVQARLQALSVLVYCNAIQDNANLLLYNGLIEELVDVLELHDPSLIEIKAASLRTLTSIIHLERNPKKKINFRITAIIDATGAAYYHGFLPVLVRSCIHALTEPDAEPFALPFATALFSFLYHLASYESGGEALVSCGMMEALLKVINWHGTEPEHITFVTRAVRVIDLITNLDMQAFQSHGGLASFIQRLEMEVDICRQELPYVIQPQQRTESSVDFPASPSAAVATANVENQVPMEIDTINVTANTSEAGPQTSDSNVASTSSQDTVGKSNILEITKYENEFGIQCFPQRAALLKSMLNFLKKAIQDPAFSDNIRHLMDGSLPRSLKHVISNAEYYGPSLFLLAMDVVTVYVFQEPSLLSSLQDIGLTDIVLQALLVKEVPATREVLASLPNVFSALCLNARGLQAFVACKPFERLFKVLLSPDYLPAMRRRRSSDPVGDTASNLGNAMDELMRHQPSLRADATAAIIKLLEELCAMGRDPKYICSRPAPKNDNTTSISTRNSNVSTDTGSSDEDDDDDDETGGNPVSSLLKSGTEKPTVPELLGTDMKTPIPLVDYILNVMRFVDAILSNNSTDDHCREFVRQKGLVPLMGILGLPNLPIDFPITPTCQAVASVCKSILNLAHEPQVLKQGLLHLNEVLQSLEPLHRPLDPPGGSVLLEELISSSNPSEATLSAQSTPLLHAMASAHAYIIMFVHVCRTGQSDIRTISISHWGSELGLSVLRGLSRLYTSLVWESTVLLALCSENTLPAGCQFGRHQLESLLPKDPLKNEKQESEMNGTTSTSDIGSIEVTSAMEALSTNGSTSVMEIDDTESNSSAAEKPKGKSSQLQAQIKQIKPLLSGASRLGRALAELFGLLVKLCVGSPVRQRRGQQISPSPTVPSPAAREVASALTSLLASGLSWEPPATSPLPKFRLTFYICSVGFTSPMLFDERKFPYHLMLQKFVSSGGQNAFFETFRWALTAGGTVPIEHGLEHPNLPDGTGEFLDAWLMLLEKMVNPKTVLESPHTLPTKSNQVGFVNFNPVHYLIRTHKLAFEAIMHLWDRKPLKMYGDRMSESMLAILCHLLRGEAVIKEKLAKEKGDNGNNGRGKKIQETEDQGINQEHLQQLMDMGFGREMVTEALLHTSSVEQATDYLLSHPAPLARGNVGLNVDWDMSEEDQMLRAIAMSLGENVLVSTSQEDAAAGKTEEVKEQEKDQQQMTQQLQEEEPLATIVIDHFTEHMLPGCLRLLDILPDTVYRACDLIVAVVVRNGEAWRERMLLQLLQEIIENVNALLKAAAPMTTSDTRSLEEWSCQLASLPEANKAAVRIHLFTLLFEEMKMPCATLAEKNGLVDLLVQLLDAAQHSLTLVKESPTPKWLAPLVLLIDLYEKAAIASRRRAPLLQIPKRQWKWFDDRSNRWNSYTANNNKSIDDAYRNGEQTVRFTAGRRRYTIQFSTMAQVNEETGNWRPVMLTAETKEESEKDKEKKENNKSKEKGMETDEASNTETVVSGTSNATSEVESVKGLVPDQCETLIRVCVGLIGVPVEPDTLHAVMRLCLRLTRNHAYAVTFAEMGGLRLLLNLTQESAFTGFTSLATLLIRHILEEPNTLRHTMEKVVRASTMGSNTPFSSKEMHYVFRVLAPASCREPTLFTDVAKNTLRIALFPMFKKDEDDSRYASANAVQMLKSLPAKPGPVPQLEGPMRLVICDLLNALTVKSVQPVPENNTNQPENIEQVSNSENQTLLRDNSSVNLLQQDDDAGIAGLDVNGETSESSVNGRERNRLCKDCVKDNKVGDTVKKSTLLLPKSIICRLLAELVRSYSGCAKLIAEYTYPAGQSELITEDCTALAFLLDNVLPQCQTVGDKDASALARVLIAALASCNHSPEAQTALVNEVKAALNRSLTLPESSEKHARIQALTGLVGTMIESCPSSSQNQLASSTFRNQQNSMNNIVRVLLRKGLVTDLARIPHCLDLSSPHMPATINSALKPLETLSRLVNLPTTQIGNRSSNRGKSSTAVIENQEQAPEAMEEDTTTTQTTSAVIGNIEVSTSEATTTYGETAVDDSAENTDSEVPDVTIAPEDVVVIPSSQSQHISETDDLDGIMDELLERHSHPDDQILGEVIIAGTNERNQSGEHEELVISVETDMDDHHDSQMISQHESEFEEDHTQGEDDHQQSSDSDSNSESGHSRSEDEAEQDDDQEDGDDDAEDEDEEEDEESHFDLNNGLQDIEEALFGMQDRDDSLFFQLEEVFPTSGTSSIVFGGSDGFRTFQIPVVTDDNTNSAENSAPSIPPAPGNVTPTHPLLVRHGDPQGAVASRLHRSNRQRGYRPALGNQTWHMYTSSGRHPNPPAILQRLLGPNTAQDILQLTSTFSSHPTSGQARVFFANSDLRILATDEDVFEIQDQNTPVSGGPSNTLASIPSALARWTEESRVLDGDSVHECVTGLKPSIISVLEKYRDEELEERLEKRKKLQEEEEIKNQQKEEKEKTEFSQIQENIAPSNVDNQETRENNTEETTLPSSSVIGPTAMEITESGQAIATDTDQTNAISGMNNVLPATPSTTTTVTTTAAVTTTTTTTPPAVVAGTTPVGTSLNTERLAASIVEQVLGPALAITSTPNPSMASTAPAVMPTLTTSSISTVVSEAINFMMGVTTANHGMTLSTSVTPFTGRWQDGTFTSSSALGIPVPSSVQQDSLGNSAVPSPMDTSEPTFVASLASETNEIACTSEAPISENQDTVGASTEQDDALHMDAELANIEREGQIPVFPGGGNEESADQSSLPQIENSMIEQSENRQTCAAEALIDAIINRATNENMGTPSSVLTESDFSNILGDVEIPEGVDPSFLAALPENIRQEVIAEQLRLQRLRQRAQAANSQATTEGGNFTEVNPEFLAALPPNIQEEVLAQQRAEQQRLAAQNSNPDTPVDPAGFIQTLPPALRQQVLADMDDSLLALLPPDLAAEAHALRRELEARHRQMQERFLSSHAGTALSRILRSAGRMGTRYTIHTVPQRGQWTWNTLSRGAGSSTAGTGGIQSGSLPSSLRLRGRQMLDHEALSCLLVLLFVDEPKLNTGRLHRVLRNLCYHAPTRQWVIKALLSVLERTKDSRLQENNHDHFSETYHRAKKSVVKTFSHTSENIGPSSHRLESASRSSQPSWLSISLDAALGCRTNVFQIHRHGHSAGPKKPSDKHSPSVTTGICQPIVTIHPQASPIVFRHVLDTLISLAKSFPIHFLPEKAKEEKYGKDVIAQDNRASKTTVPITAKSDSKQILSTSSKTEACGSLSRQDTDFWDVLIKLDSLSTSRKGKSIARTHSTTTMIGSNSNANIDDDTKYQSFEASPMAQLISMLSHPVVKRSSLLTDRLLRLLALISLALPDQDSQNYTQSTNQLLSVNATANLRNGTNSLISRAMEVPSCGRDDSHPVAEEKTAASEDDKVPSKESISHVQLGEEEEKEDIIIKQHLKLAVEVLTSKTCSEEGLEDATALLLRLSRSCARTRKSVLHLLLEGARELGQVVCLHIRALIEELRNLNARLAVERIATNELEEKENEAEAKLIKGMIQDRFTHTTVIITAPTKVKGSGSRELQLPSMAALTSKTSSQAFFLRILKVIIQLREATRLAQQRARQASVSSDVLQQSVLTSQNLPETQLSVLQETIASNENEGSNEGNQQATPMEIDTVTPSSQNSKKEPVEEEPCLPPLSFQLSLEELWETLSECLVELAETPDHHAVLVLQPAVEAFFLVHASSSEKESNKRKEYRQESRENQLAHIHQDIAPLSPLPATSEAATIAETSNIVFSRENSLATISTALPADTQKFLKFAETHRTVLNQILRQSTTPLADGPFSVLVDHTRVLDFDVKRRYFRQELERMDEGARREDLAVHVRREHVFEDSFRELHRRSPEEWKNRFYIVFEGEEGQDAGGLLREWYTIISREIFNPMYALFTISPGDRVTYMINQSSHCNSNHLSYFKFVGRVIAKAVYDNKLLECYFTRSFYKHILGKLVKYTDMESEDYSFYQGLVFLLEHDVKEIGYELTFSVEVQEFGVTEIRDLKPNGQNVMVTEENKQEYVRLVCQEKMTGAIRKQLNAFLEGFYEIIPKRLIAIFNEQELELLISGLPNVDIDDLKANTEYHKYQPTSLQIQWFWRALRSFDQADRAKFLQFVTGTSKVPLQGFSALEGMNGIQKFQIHRDDRSTDRLPSAHTCFNQLDLPAYETYDKLRSMLLKAIQECSEGFGFA